MITLNTETTSSQSVRRDPEWLDAHRMPFTANRSFKVDARIVVEARLEACCIDSTPPGGRAITLDGSGLGRS